MPPSPPASIALPGPKLFIQGPLTLTQDGKTSTIDNLTISESPAGKDINLHFAPPKNAGGSKWEFDRNGTWEFVGGTWVSYEPGIPGTPGYSFALRRCFDNGDVGSRIEFEHIGEGTFRLAVCLPTLGSEGIQHETRFVERNDSFGEVCEDLYSIEDKAPGAADDLVAALGEKAGVWKYNRCTVHIAEKTIRWQYHDLVRNGAAADTRLCSKEGHIRFALDPDAVTTVAFRPAALSLVLTATWDELTHDPVIRLEAELGDNWTQKPGDSAPPPGTVSPSHFIDAANRQAGEARRALGDVMAAQSESFLPEITLDKGGSGRQMLAVQFYRQQRPLTEDGRIELPRRDTGTQAVVSLLSQFPRSKGPGAVVATLALPGIGPPNPFTVELDHDPNCLETEASTGDVIASFRLRRGGIKPSGKWSTRLGSLSLEASKGGGLANEPTDGSSMSRMVITRPRRRVPDPKAPPSGLPEVGVEWHLRLEVDRVTPEGVDRPWGDREDRRLPLVVPREREKPTLDAHTPGTSEQQQQQPPFVLIVDESIGPQQDRWFRATLLDNFADSGDQDLVSTLLSFEPWSVLRFTRRRLERLGNAENAAVAIFDGDQRAWRVKQAVPEYAYEFPVQGIGESADKPGILEIHDLSTATSERFTNDVIRQATSGPIAVLRPGPAGDSATGDGIDRRFVLETRFGPSLELWVKPSDLDRNYILPEWQAHEIFRRRNDFGLGVALRAVRGEFLYGLSFGVDVSRELGQAALARVAEIEALTGKLPPLLLNPTPSARQTKLIERWRSLRRALLRRSERIELWTPAYDQIRPFVHARFERGATFALRTTALHRHPIDPPAIGDRKAADSAQPLARRLLSHGLPGGALWPMESLAILNEVLDKPTPTGGTIERIAICPGGGDADQSVEFAGGHVTIASQTRAGFLQRQRIEVLGRIGVFWHRAKHVIVYERTVNPSEQFAPEADAAGWHATRSRRAIMRKVSEYIEILQPTRSYPDAGPAEGTDCGFLDSVRFNTRIIHVDGSWKTEWKKEGDRPAGYKIPLWNAGAAEQRPNVYPLPSVTAVTLGEGKEKRPLVPRQIANPENLFFFTQKAADGGSTPVPCDPDAWDPFFGVDYGNLADPAALERLVAPGGDRYGVTAAGQQDDGQFAKGRKPSTPRVLPGYHRFTWRLLPDGKRTAINAGFGDKPVYGDLDSITFSRGTADTDSATALLQAAASNPQQVLANQLRTINTESVDADLITDCHERLIKPCNNLKSKLNDTSVTTRLADLFKSPINCGKLQGLVDDAISKKRVLIQTIFRDWALTASRWSNKEMEQAARRHGDNVREMVADLLGIEQMVHGLLGSVETGIGSIRADIATLRRAITDCIVGLRTHVMRTTTRFEAALDAANRDIAATGNAWERVYAATRTLVITDLETLKAEIEAETDETLRRIAVESTPFVTPIVQELQTLLSDFVSTTATNCVTSVKTNLPDPKPGPLPPSAILGQCRAQVATVKDEVARLERDLIQHLDKFIAATQGLLASTASAVAGSSPSVLETLNVYREGISSYITGSGILAEICLQLPDTFLAEQATVLRNTVSVRLADLAQDERLDTWTKDVANGCREALKTQLDQACKAADILPGKADLDELRETLLPEKITSAIKAIEDVGQDVEKIKKALRDAETPFKDWEKSANSAPALATAYRARVSEALSDIDHGGPKPGKILALMSAATQAPEIGQMQANIDRMRCSFKKGQIETSKAMAAFSKLGAALKALGIELPFDGLDDQLKIDDKAFPDFREKFDLQRLLPDFGGIKLDGLLEGVKLPETSAEFREAVKVRHDFDKVHFRAWAQIDVNMPIKDRKKLFGIGPMTMYFRESLLTGSVRAEASKDTPDASTTGSGLIETNIDVDVSGELIVSLEKVRIEYSKEKKLHVDFDPKRIRLHSAMQFVQDTFGDLLGDEIGGLTIIKEKGFPVGLEHQFKLPVMSLMAGTSGISNIQMSNAFRLLAYPDFVISNRFCLSRPELPFLFTFFILGGTGYVIVDSRYRPFDKALTVEVEAAIGGAAALGISAGAISGQVFITLSIALTYRKTFTGGGASGDGLSVAALLVVAGNVNIAGVVDVYIGVMLRLTYREGGAIDGVGTVSVTVKVSVFFTFKFRSEMTLKMRGGRAETTKKISTSVEPGQAVEELRKKADDYKQKAKRLAKTRA